MKLIFIITTFTIAVATSAFANQTAYQLRDQYINIATILATKYKQDGACGGSIEIYQEEIVRAVEKARYYHDYDNSNPFQLPQVVKSVLTSTLALKSVFRMIDLNNPASVAYSLPNVVFYGPARGAYGNTEILSFKKDGNITVSNLELLDAEPYYRWIHKNDTYSVEKTTVAGKSVIQIKFGSGKIEPHILNAPTYPDSSSNNQWNLVPVSKPNANPHFDGYTDFPSECEA